MYDLVEIAILNALAAAALAVVVLLISRLLRRPALLHALWVLVLLKLVTPPIIEVPVGLRLERLAALTEVRQREQAIPDDSLQPRVAETPIVVVTSTSAGPAAPNRLPHHESRAGTPPATTKNGMIEIVTTVPLSIELRKWIAFAIPVALCLWVLGTITWFSVQSWRITRFAKLASTARLASEEIQQQAAQIGASIGARRAPRIWILDATMSPTLWSIGSRARIIFPAALLVRVNPDARATLLTHELAHYHRGDHWVRLLEFVVTGLFWWHPAVWIARHEIEVSEEHCCDAWVVGQFPGAPRCYAEALLDTIDFLSEHRPRRVPVATGLGQVPFLRERIRLIMSGVAPKSMSGTTRLGVLAVAAVLLPLGPQLFDGAIRRADAALEKLDLPSMSGLTMAMAPQESAASAVAEAEEAGVPSARQTVDRPEDEPIGVPAAEVAAWAVVNSPDGRFQAVAKVDGGLVLRDTFHQRSFNLTEYQISSIAFAPHRELLVAGSADATVYLFDCASGEPVTTFTGHHAPVASVAVSLDGQYVVSGSRDGAVKLWDMDYEQEVPSRIPAQSSPVNCVRFSPDGRLLAIASGDWLTSDAGSVLLWDLRGGTIGQRFETPSPIGAVAFDANQLVAAQWNGRVTRWNPDSGRETLATIDKNTVSAAAFAADAQSLLIAGMSGEQTSATAFSWFRRMDRNGDGRLAWNEFQGPRGTFRRLDVDEDDIVSWDEVAAVQ